MVNIILTINIYGIKRMVKIEKINLMFAVLTHKIYRMKTHNNLYCKFIVQPILYYEHMIDFYRSYGMI